MWEFVEVKNQASICTEGKVELFDTSDSSYGSVRLKATVSTARRNTLYNFISLLLLDIDIFTNRPFPN